MNLVLASVLAAGLSLAAGTWLLRRAAAYSWPQRICAFLVPPLLLLCVAESVAKILTADRYLWNEVRLARTFGLYAGVPLYPGRDASGPILGTLHTPLSHIFYWPATLAGNPVAAVHTGVALSVLLLLGTLAYVQGKFRATGPDSSVLLPVFAVELFWLGVLNTTILSCVFVIHADPVALACATVAGGLLCASPIGKQRLLLSALFAVLTVASKQTFAPLPVALALFLLIAEGRRTFFRYCAWVAAWGVASAAAIIALFRPARDLIFNLITLPSHRPPQPIMFKLPHVHDSFHLFCFRLYHLVGHALHSGTEGRALLTFVVLLYLWLWLLRGRHPTLAPQDLRQIIARNRWTVFLFIAVALFPLLFKASITLGGDENHLAIVDFFLLLSLTTSFLQFTGTPQAVRGLQLPYLFVFALIALFSFRSVHQFRRALAPATSLTGKAAAFSRTHPGVAYFPSNPLSSFYAEHRFYTFDHSVSDRDIAGFPLSPAQYAGGIPADVAWIALEPRQVMLGEVSQPLRNYLACGWVVDNNGALPDFLVYRRASPLASSSCSGTAVRLPVR